MKPIKITPENAEKIEASLAEINGRATAHAYTRASDILALVQWADRRLLALLGIKKDMPGATLEAVSGDAVSNAYARKSFSPRAATQVSLELRGSGWFLTKVSKGSVWADGGDVTLGLTAKQDAIAVARLRGGYVVTSAPC